jgi:hypothetical protein
VALPVLAATLLLSACGNGTPGVAAVVEGDKITDQQVDDFAQVLCTLGAVQGTQSGTPTRAVRFRSLQVLVGDRLAADMTDLGAVDKKTVNGVLQQMEAGRSQVPSRLRPTFDEVAEEFARAQTAIVELGRRSLVAQGTAPDKVDGNAAFTEGERLRAKFAASADIEVDPRYGTVVDGQLRPEDGSLSVPVSDLARGGSASALQPDEAVVGQLPASQKCG